MTSEPDRAALARWTPARLARRPVVAVALLSLVAASCVIKSTRVDRAPLDADAAATAQVVETPFKAWLVSGDVVEFRGGALFAEDSIFGAGVRSSAARSSELVMAVPLDSLAALEVFDENENRGTTVLLSSLATLGIAAAATVAAGGLAVAIFGSCPTVYSASPAGPVLEAETFSYSIAPLFEARDVDRLAALPDADGVLRLEIRNEALETHYINQLQLLEVRHGAEEMAYADPEGRPLVLRDLRPPERAAARGGRDVGDVLASRDGLHYRTAPEVLARASSADPADTLRLTFAADSGRESALVLRLRNSLLNTALLYDVMLSGSGPASLDWLGRDLARIPEAVELGSWYARNTGIRIWLETEDGPREIGRIPDEGPIAWSEIAVPVPAPESDSLRLTLTFPADSWRIDRARIAGGVRRPQARVLPPARLVAAGGQRDTAALAAVAEADDRRLKTIPGDAFTVEFDAPAGADATRTYFLASQGYYIEWIRRDWIRPTERPWDFRPSPRALDATFERWRETSADLEARFENSRIPVR